MQGKLDEAIEAFGAALQIDPEYAPARSNLALAERMKQKKP
jgi:tetratricopeptide (TPR) repeat protein